MGNVVICRRCVLFLDTAIVPAQESRNGVFIQNKTECVIVHQIVEALIASGLPGHKVGVISPYRSQLRVMTELLNRHASVEVSTVDKYQGRDKDCVIVSMVRSNNENIVGDLLNDWRRINVAFTRAKTKLLIVGSRKTLETNTIFGTFFKLAESRKWV